MNTDQNPAQLGQNQSGLDQNKPVPQTKPSLGANVEVNVTNPFTETLATPVAETAYTATPENVSEPITSLSPMVAVSGGGGSVPPWFYLIFGLTVVAFFLVTSLLVFSFFSKQTSPSPSLLSPSPTIVSRENSVPVSSPIPTPTSVDAYLDSLKNVSDSDSLAEIEKDVVGTDVTKLEQEMKSLDSELDLTF